MTKKEIRYLLRYSLYSLCTINRKFVLFKFPDRAGMMRSCLKLGEDFGASQIVENYTQKTFNSDCHRSF